MSQKYLETSQEIRDSIRDLFIGDEEKYAVVAFIGKNATNYLPNSKNLTVICWPKAGGTNPNGIRKLLDKGIRVQFCDNLHSKIFWCKSKGIIITSANLSDNALGENGLIEYGVRINDSHYDFNKSVLNNLHKNIRDVTNKELDLLDINHNKYYRKNPIELTNKTKNINFAEWYKGEHKQKWKVIWYSEESKSDEQTKNEVYQKYHVKDWINDNDADSKSFNEGDIVFQFKMHEEEGKIKRINGKWLYVDMTTTTNKIIQIDEIETISLPFLIDKSFMKSFKKAFNKLEWNEIHDSSYNVNNVLIDAIYMDYIN